MIELNADRLVVSFPEMAFTPKVTIDFQRTLRIPDDDREYPLPPGFGSFPLRHIDDFAGNVPEKWLQRGGVLLPMWQSEALWLNFHCCHVPERAVYPFAIKVAAGKINAITGEKWANGLSRNPQSYLVAPAQPWLDGYCVDKGIIRQFVAMPLGTGYSAEEQLTGEGEFGGMQIEVVPMKTEVFERRFPFVPSPPRETKLRYSMMLLDMGLAPGGRMRQEIFEDPYSIHDWDTGRGSRCFIHLVNSEAWHRITGQSPPSPPLRAKDYSRARLPWFDYYDDRQKAIGGSGILASLLGIGGMSKKKGETMAGNQSVNAGPVINLRAGLKQNQVRESDFS